MLIGEEMKILSSQPIDTSSLWQMELLSGAPVLQEEQAVALPSVENEYVAASVCAAK